MSQYKLQSLSPPPLLQVQVFRVDDVQGKEYRALLISTVRTCSTEPPAEEEAGFLTNPKVSHDYHVTVMWPEIFELVWLFSILPLLCS